jgi:type IV pilus assembly protein PilQ
MNDKLKILLIFLFLIQPLKFYAQESTFTQGTTQQAETKSSIEVLKTENNELKDIVVNKDFIEIIFSIKPDFVKSTLDNPPRVVVDVKNCILKFDKEEVVVNNGYVKKIRVGQFKKEPQVVRIVFDLVKKRDYEITLEENKLKILLPIRKVEKEPSSAESAKPSKEKFTLPKTLVTLECVDADIPDVLQMLAIKAKVNIIYGPDVTGKVTISLKNVPFDKAFENLLKITKLSYAPVSENIIRVATPETFEKERSLDVVYTKIFPLNYATATEVKSQIDQIRQAEGRTKGMISVDQRTNSLIVTETEEGLAYIEELIKKLDVKPYQVSIEVQIIDISADDLRDLGIQWGLGGFQVSEGQGVGFAFQKTVPGGVDVTNSGTGELNTGEALTSVFPTGVSPFATFAFGRFTKDFGMTAQAAVAALVSKGKAKILSNPRVTTLNNKTAVILAGERIPYKTSKTQTTTGAGGISTVQETWEYITAGIQLTVTPTVSPEGWITLTVKPKVDIPQISAAGAPPTVKSRETEVTVMLKNNEPLIIGGLITDQDIETIRKVPLLGDVPILGYLFKYKGTSKQRTELVIMITPRIIEN